MNILYGSFFLAPDVLQNNFNSLATCKLILATEINFDNPKRLFRDNSLEAYFSTCPDFRVHNLAMFDSSASGEIICIRNTSGFSYRNVMEYCYDFLKQECLHVLYESEG